MVYHALNQANFRSTFFKKGAHDQDFPALVAEGADVVPMRLLAYCLMPNHGHMVL
jgi:putative transposase